MQQSKRQISGGKKFVVKACKGGKEKIIRFGIQYEDTKIKPQS